MPRPQEADRAHLDILQEGRPFCGQPHGYHCEPSTELWHHIFKNLSWSPCIADSTWLSSMQGHPGIFLQFGSLIKYFKDVKLERQPPQVHHYEGSGIAKVSCKHPLPATDITGNTRVYWQKQSCSYELQTRHAVLQFRHLEASQSRSCVVTFTRYMSAGVTLRGISVKRTANQYAQHSNLSPFYCASGPAWSRKLSAFPLNQILERCWVNSGPGRRCNCFVGLHSLPCAQHTQKQLEAPSASAFQGLASSLNLDAAASAMQRAGLTALQ